MTVDIDALTGGTQQIVAAGQNGLIVSGMAKLVQRFILELMTSTNSAPRSTQGCAFVPRLQAGVATENDVLVAFHSALNQAVNLLQAAQLPTDPPDEILAGVKVNGLIVGNGSLTLKLTLANRAGGVLGVILPLNFLLETLPVAAE